MTKPRHTPGPWDIGKGGGCVITDAGTPEDMLGKGHDERDYYGGLLICESIARRVDATLIAAAPELLKMLQDIHEGEYGYGEWPDESEILALIARATRE